MSFLAPLFLLGGAAVALPILYHLVRRTTRERTPFSSLMFLRPSPPRLSERSRLENLLLLILRALVVILLALGFARPFFTGSDAQAADTAPARRVVLLIDRSASMQRGDLWSAARDQARSLLRELTAADQAAVLVFAHDVRPLVSFTDWAATPLGDRVGLVQSRLADAAPGWGATRLDQALIRAADLLTEAEALEARREIVLISDLQEGSRLNGLQVYAWPEGVALTVLALDAPSGSNAGLAFAGERREQGAAAARSVRARVTNDGASQQEAFQLTWIDAQGSATGEPVPLQAPPGQSRIVTLELPDTPVLPRRIRLAGDDHPFDNTVHVIPPPVAEATVLYLGDDVPAVSRGSLFFLERALQETPRQVIRLLPRQPDEPLSPTDLAGAALIVVSGTLPDAAKSAVEAWASAGGTVLVVASNDAAVTSTQSAAAADQYVMLAEIDFQHPLFAPFADPRFSDFTKIRFWQHRLLAEPEASDAATRVLARFDDQSPALLETVQGRGRLLTLASGWSATDSTLALSTKFVPLLYSLLDLAGAAPASASQFLVGDPLPLGPYIPAAGATLRQPDGATFMITPEDGEFTGTDLPGVYRLETGDQPVEFAVNLDPAESRTAPLAVGELEAFGVTEVADPASAVVAEQRKARVQRAELEARQKLWRWLLAAAVGVLLFETWLAGRTARRHPTAAPVTP
jgi:hypothetical protein